MSYVIGADEVGRGCLAGPLCVGAFMVPTSMTRIEGVTDSKKLSASSREAVFARLRERPGCRFNTVLIPAADIDRFGLSWALVQGFKQAVQGLLDVGFPVEEVLIDGNPISVGFGDVPTRFLVKGDALDWRVGAASIVAKVTRDRLMVEEAKNHPGYGWETNVGYGSKDHIAAIQELGLTLLHRKGFCRGFQPSTLDLFG